VKLLFLFLDGVGLGEDDPDVNPFSRAKMPVLRSMLGGKPLTRHAAPFSGPHATLLALDACLGVAGYPQSATGQGVLLTGINIPAELGYHYGPKPNPQVAKYLISNTLFARLKQAGKTCALLNAYPPRYFEGIDSGKRLYSSIPMTVTNAGLPLFTKDDYFAGRGLSADFTGQGWQTFLGFPESPLFESREAGLELARLASQYDFSMFEYWASDYAGHKQDMAAALEQLEGFDSVLQGLLDGWDLETGMILITSDHGNLEDLTVRRHTDNHVPALIFGRAESREAFAEGLTDLTHITPAIWKTVTQEQE
jgi:2,3-bisphosphoglycerate-independent phosphoglycerate mutase